MSLPDPRVVDPDTGEVVAASLQVMPVLEADIAAALRDSIQRFGVLVPIVMDQHGRIIDGHNRHRIADELLVDCPAEIRHVDSDAEALELARTLNADRRHLNAEARAQVARSLREKGHSLRAIAGALGVDKRTVGRDLDETQVQLGHDAPVDNESVEDDRAFGQDGKSRPSKRHVWTDDEIADVLSRLANDETQATIAVSYGVGQSAISELLKRLREKSPIDEHVMTGNTREAVRNRERRFLELAQSGHTSEQIAKDIGLSRKSIWDIAKRLGVEVAADAVVGRSRRIDSNRVVESTVMDLDALAMSVDLVNFDDLDASELEGWVTSLNHSLRQVNRFHKRLKEMTQ